MSRMSRIEWKKFWAEGFELSWNIWTMSLAQQTLARLHGRWTISSYQNIFKKAWIVE